MNGDKIEREFECYGCGSEVSHNPTKSFIPTGWRIIKLHSRPQQFCDSCKWGFDYHPGAEHPSEIYPQMRDQLARGHGVKLD
ncbi:MAG: hypothetical protein HYZ50_23070 [Deltaproteobacteria bacterium]|nr:hypothetical protein [Deltaproteobacteria bacterium]